MKPFPHTSDNYINTLIREVELAYDKVVITTHKSEAVICEELTEYHLMVEELVELTNVDLPAYYTDPMLCDDYDQLYDTRPYNMTYNQMMDKLYEGGIPGQS